MSYSPQAIIDKLRAMQIPAPDLDVLRDVIQIEGIDMVTAAIDAAGRKSQKATNYLKGIFFAVTPGTKERLLRQKMTALALPILIAIGKNEGPDFSLRLKAWDANGGGEGDNARYIRLTVARYLQAARQAEERGSQQEMGSRGGGRGQEQPSRRPQHGQDNHQQGAGQQRPPQSNGNQDSDRPGGLQGGSVHHLNRDRPSHSRDDGPIEPQGTAEESDPNHRDFLSIHIYGGKAAACFSADKTRGGTYTVRMEAAEANGNRSYDWKGKVSIQLSSRELPLVLGSLMQWITKFEGKGHGENNEKWFTLENQPGKLYLSVNAKGRAPRGIPIMPGDAYSITTLLIRQMLKNDPFLTTEAVLTLTKTQANMLNGMSQRDGHNQQQRAA